LEQAGIAAEDLGVVLEEFGRQRLLTFDRDPSSRTPTVEVAHEALLTEWDRLKGWIDDAREDLLARRRLEVATHEWLNADCDGSFLIGGGRLQLTEAWATDSGFALTHDEQRFLSTSRAKSDLELRSRARRRRRAVGALLVALLATTTLAGVAFRQRNRANTAARLAEARRVRTQALAAEDYDQALLLAVEGRHLENSPEARKNLLAVIQRSDATAVIRSQTEAILDLGVTPDGKTLLASGIGETPTMSKYDVTTRKREASIPGTATTASSAISPDGRLAAMTYYTGTFGDRTFHLHIVDMATFTVVGELLSGPFDAAPMRLKFSPDGRYVAAVTDQDLSGAGVADAVAFVWDVVKGGDPIVRYQFSAPDYQRDVVFLPNSKRILVAGADGIATIDIASGTKVGQIDGAHAPIAISPDGRTLAATIDPSQGVVIGLFDPTSGQRQTVLAGHRERLVRLAFSPDGSTLASGADDRLVMLWAAATGDRLAVFTGHTAGVNALAFSPDGKTLWSGGDDRAIFRWDLQRAATLFHRVTTATVDTQALPFTAQGMVIAEDGRYVAFPSTDTASFAIRNVATGRIVRTSAPQDGNFMSFSPDGTQYLTVDEHLRLRAWDLGTGAVLADSNGSGQQFTGFHEGTAVFTSDGHNVVALQLDPSRGREQLVVLDAATLAPVGGEPVATTSTGRMVSVTPDGRAAVVVDSSTTLDPETTVLLVDLETRRVAKSTPVAPGGEPFGGARNNTVAPDGRTVGIGGNTGDVVVVDPQTGSVSPLLHAHDGRVESVTFAPDKASFVTTGQDGAVKLWDAATQHLLASFLPFGANHRVRASFVAADRVVIVDDTGEIREWDPRPDSWEAYACKVAGRNLTKAEWVELFPGQAYRVTCPDFPAGG
jgi:WD40 repeat protein